MGGGELGCEAHWRVWVSLLALRPARARVLRRGWERNLRASFTTYLPVKPEAPTMIRS